MNNLDKELKQLVLETIPINYDHTKSAREFIDDAIPQIKQIILKELEVSMPTETDMGEQYSYNVGYNQALSDFEAVLYTVLGGKE